jgi:phosphatidylglycerophosphate synthase
VSALVITRDVVIVGVALTLYLAQGVTRFPPSGLSKVNTAVQISAIALVLLSGLQPALELTALIACFLVALLTLASGIDYIRLANRMTPSR